MAAAANLLCLPTELQLHIFSYLDTRSLAIVLRVNRMIHFLVQPIFWTCLELDETSLWRCPLSAEDLIVPAQSCGHDSQEREQAIINYGTHLKSLCLALNNASEDYERRRYGRIPFISLGDEASLILRQQSLRDRVQASLQRLVYGLTIRAAVFTAEGFIRHPPSPPPIASRLVRLSFVAKSEQTPAPWGHRWGQTRRAYLRQQDILCFLQVLGACSNVRDLELDTADAEETEWIPNQGIGPACSKHVCEVFASNLIGLNKLQTLRWRRRDICPRMFDSVIAKGMPDATLRQDILPNLNSVIIDLRLATTQRTSTDTWEAQSRHCGCTCWCMTCIKRLGASKNSSPSDRRGIRQPSHHGAMLQHMAEACAEVAKQLGSVRTLQVLGYDEPGRDLDSWARMPCALDCLSRKKRFTYVGGERPCPAETSWP